MSMASKMEIQKQNISSYISNCIEKETATKSVFEAHPEISIDSSSELVIFYLKELLNNCLSAESKSLFIIEINRLFSPKSLGILSRFFDFLEPSSIKEFLKSLEMEAKESLFLGLDLVTCSEKYHDFGSLLVEKNILAVDYQSLTDNQIRLVFQLISAINLPFKSECINLLKQFVPEEKIYSLNQLSMDSKSTSSKTYQSPFSLMQLYRDAGSSTSTEGVTEFLKNVFPDKVTEVEIANIIMSFYSVNPLKKVIVEPESLVSPDVLNNAIKNLKDAPNWELVVKEFDHEEFNLIEPTKFSNFIKFLELVFEDVNKIPIKYFISIRWKHRESQLKFVKMVTQIPDLINLSNFISAKKIITFEELTLVSGNSKNVLSVLYYQTWNCLDVFDLVNESIIEFQEESAQILELAAKQSPELLCLALSHINPLRSPALKDLLAKLASGFILGQQNSTVVISRLWHADYTFIVQCMVDLHHRDPTCLSRLLDVAQDLKNLTQILNCKSYFFSIDMAALASRREHLNLEKWLHDMIQEQKEVFLKACLDFLSEKISLQISRMEGKSSSPFIPLSMDVMNIFVKTLSSYAHLMSPEFLEVFQMIQNVLGGHPVSVDPTNSSYASSKPGELSSEVDSGQQFPADIEEEANSYFEKIYAKELSVKELIDILLVLKGSRVQRDQDVFSCMIHNLFDEYRFFPKYPEKELSLTAILFGSLIQYQLISYLPLGVALRYVLDSLKKSPGSKMFKFGLQALLQFQSRLPEWPQYCSHIMSISHLHQVFPDLINYLKQVVTGAGPAPNNIGNAAGNAIMAQLSSAVNNMSISNGNGAETIKATDNQVEDHTPFKSIRLHNFQHDLAKLGKFENTVPNEVIQDKVLFILNNLSSLNISVKTQEMSSYLNEDYYKWFANYLVTKRAVQEPNYHSTYILMLKGLNASALDQIVLCETFSSIKEIISSEKTLTSSQERTVLKNLATWLGGITIAQNKPLLHKYISLRELLIEGYELDRLIVVIPFICKVLEQSHKSIIFKPPNPWLMKTIKLLAELYHFAELKLNLKFEIEVLCKNIQLDMKSVEPSDEIRKRLSNHSYPVATKPDNSMAPYAKNQMKVVNNSPEMYLIAIPNLLNYISIRQNVLPSVRQIVCVAIDFSIREVVGPVVERSVAIACITTREIILKDFAFDGKEDKMKKCAILMVQNVAGNLAMATSKEPLRSTVMLNIKNFLQVAGLENQLNDQSIQTIADDNLDLCCAFVEKSAIEKSVQDVCETLATAFNLRKKHRERSHQPFVDPAFINSSPFFNLVPEYLKSKADGLTPNQIKVYDDFLPSRLNALSNLETPVPLLTNVDYDKLSAFLKGINANVSSTSSAGSPPRAAASFTPQSTSTASNVYFDETSKNVLSTQQCLERFLLIIAEVEKIVYQNSTLSLSSFPANHELRSLLRQILLVVLHAYNRDEVALVFSQKVVQMLYKTDSPLLREISVILLDKLCEISPKVAKEVTTWIIYADDERKYNVSVTIALLLSGLLNVVEYDMQMAKIMETGRISAIEFCVKLVRRCVLDEPAIASPYDFVYSIETLNRIAQRTKGPDSLLNLLEDISKKVSNHSSAAKDEETEVRNRVAVVFNDWLRLYQYPTADGEKALQPFVIQLQQQGILKDEMMTSLFFKVCIELSVEYYLKNRNNSSAVSYQAVDGYARLVVLLVANKHEIGSPGGPANLLAEVLTIVSMLLIQSLERRNFVVQRPFSRFFNSVLSDITHYKSTFADPNMYFQLIGIFTELMHSLNPQNVPAFTFAWLEIVSSKYFMPVLLENKKGWSSVQRLIVDILKFLYPYLKQIDLRESIRVLYRGFLRVFLVILHDYPDFLAEYYMSFCDVIPLTCVQLRNLILSAFPKSMKLIDPFSPDLVIESLPESKIPPLIVTDDREEMFMKQNAAEFKRMFSMQEDRTPSFTHAFVFYLGIKCMKEERLTNNFKNDYYEVFSYFLETLDSENRYVFLNGIANHLRYPNIHTSFFSKLLLSLFDGTSNELFKEQITRVLLERLIVNRPHPWGLLVTFIELIKNPSYNFWSFKFTRIAPDIERLFDSVARSCMLR